MTDHIQAYTTLPDGRQAAIITDKPVEAGDPEPDGEAQPEAGG
jgi:hypothetical protein